MDHAHPARHGRRFPAPTISGQRVTSSVEAKPCLAKASSSVLPTIWPTARRRIARACSWRHGSATSARHDASRQTQRREARDSAWSASADRRCAWYDRHRRVLPWRARAGRARRSLSRLALRDHAAADHREGGRALFRALPRALADGARARGGAARRRAEALGRARLLRARPQPACLRQGGGRAAWRTISRRAKQSCARCPASAPTRRPRSRRSRSSARAARSTAISSA